MRLVIDLQGAQGCSRDRGIGRYSLSFAKALARNHREHEVLIALNGRFTDTIEPIRAALNGVVPQENIRVWMSPDNFNRGAFYEKSCSRIDELIREQFLSTLNPDVVLVSSLFEGFYDETVTGLGDFSCHFKMAVVLYDLIPLVHGDLYLHNSKIKNWYTQKIHDLKRADCLLSISEATGREAVDELGLDREKVHVISSAVEEYFRPKRLSDGDRVILGERYGLTRPFLLSTSGIDRRKNIEGLITAFGSLSRELKDQHQLAIVCDVNDAQRLRFNKIAMDAGLSQDQLIITGYVSDDDLLLLYNGCKAFVFPSLYEGFGLPVLEAMSCGKAVIASNCSSLPEVVGCDDALFDPHDYRDIAKKISTVLIDDDYRSELERHGLRQAKNFSWDHCALRAWQALEDAISVESLTALSPSHKHRLAFISPLPPEASGISDYSAELLPELSQHYEIDVIVTEDRVSDPWVRGNCAILDVAWFREHADQYDRVLYHFGNSQFHSHMFALLREIPGVVVLHDFFLSGVLANFDECYASPYGWANALYHSHGWQALFAHYQSSVKEQVMLKYPANLQILQEALGVIVHSDMSCKLADEWYGAGASESWDLIPLMRKPADGDGRAEARRLLGISDDEFVVCSFGFLGPTKLNHRLLNAWLASPLKNDPRCRLVFVGHSHHGRYGVDLERQIRKASLKHRVQITGWAEPSIYHQWLAAADVGVQLRSQSRGETSAALLDCMNYGLPTIANANGSVSELPQDCIWMLPDLFEDHELQEALVKLWSERRGGQELGARAKAYLSSMHEPRKCAAQYAAAIERSYQRAGIGMPGLVRALAKEQTIITDKDLPVVAACIAENLPAHPAQKQLLVDFTQLISLEDLSEVDKLVQELLFLSTSGSLDGWRIEPVYKVSETGSYRYARRFMSRFLGVADDWAVDEIVETQVGDIYLGFEADLRDGVEMSPVILHWRRRGVSVQLLFRDPPEVAKVDFDSSGVSDGDEDSTSIICCADRAICFSHQVADDLRRRFEKTSEKDYRPVDVALFAADVTLSDVSAEAKARLSRQLFEFVTGPKKAVDLPTAG